MKNKKIISIGLLLSLLVMVRACGQMTTKVSVKDEQGNPIEGAEVRFSYARPQGYESVSKLTNAEGLVKDTGKTNFHLNVRAEKAGFYKVTYAKSNKGTHLEKGQNHDLIVTLKKIKNPIALYVKKAFLKAPEERVKLGYDFEVGDWVKPHGKGKVADIIIYSSSDRKSGVDYDYKFNVTFPNPLDGLQSFESDWISELRSSHDAPLKGYNPKLNLHWWRKPDSNGEQGNQKDGNQNYWLRIRSEVDEEGNLFSAHYVKIYGDFPDIQYYFNPNFNDRNLEFAPNKNLFKNLDWREQIHMPKP